LLEVTESLVVYTDQLLFRTYHKYLQSEELP